MDFLFGLIRRKMNNISDNKDISSCSASNSSHTLASSGACSSSHSSHCSCDDCPFSSIMSMLFYEKMSCNDVTTTTTHTSDPVNLIESGNNLFRDVSKLDGLVAESTVSDCKENDLQKTSCWKLSVAAYVPIVLHTCIFGTLYVARSVILGYWGIIPYALHFVFVTFTKVFSSPWLGFLQFDHQLNDEQHCHGINNITMNHTSIQLQKVETFVTHNQTTDNVDDGTNYYDYVNNTSPVTTSTMIVSGVAIAASVAILGTGASFFFSNGQTQQQNDACNPQSIIAFLSILTITTLIVHPDGFTWIIIRHIRDALSYILKSIASCWALLIIDFGSTISTVLALLTFMSLFLLAYALHLTLKNRSNGKGISRSLSRSVKHKRKKRTNKHNNASSRNKPTVTGAAQNEDNDFATTESQCQEDVDNQRESQIGEVSIILQPHTSSFPVNENVVEHKTTDNKGTNESAHVEDILQKSAANPTHCHDVHPTSLPKKNLPNCQTELKKSSLEVASDSTVVASNISLTSVSQHSGGQHQNRPGLLRLSRTTSASTLDSSMTDEQSCGSNDILAANHISGKHHSTTSSQNPSLTHTTGDRTRKNIRDQKMNGRRTVGNQSSKRKIGRKGRGGNAIDHENSNATTQHMVETEPCSTAGSRWDVLKPSPGSNRHCNTQGPPHSSKRSNKSFHVPKSAIQMDTRPPRTHCPVTVASCDVDAAYSKAQSRPDMVVHDNIINATNQASVHMTPQKSDFVAEPLFPSELREVPSCNRTRAESSSTVSSLYYLNANCFGSHGETLNVDYGNIDDARSRLYGGDVSYPNRSDSPLTYFEQQRHMSHPVTEGREGHIDSACYGPNQFYESQRDNNGSLLVPSTHEQFSLFDHNTGKESREQCVITNCTQGSIVAPPGLILDNSTSLLYQTTDNASQKISTIEYMSRPSPISMYETVTQQHNQPPVLASNMNENPFQMYYTKNYYDDVDDEERYEAELQELGGQMVGSILD